MKWILSHKRHPDFTLVRDKMSCQMIADISISIHKIIRICLIIRKISQKLERLETKIIENPHERVGTGRVEKVPDLLCGGFGPSPRVQAVFDLYCLYKF